MYTKPFGPDNGFSAIELVVVMSIFAVLAAIAAPKFNELAGSSERFAARAHLLEDIKTAQAFTLTQGCRGIMTVASDGRSYSFGCDYLAYDTAETPVADSIEFTRELAGDVTMEADAIIILNSRGQTVNITDQQVNIVIELESEIQGTREVYARGTLLGTGVFEYDAL